MRQKEDGVKTPEHCQIFLMQADIALERIAKKSRRLTGSRTGRSLLCRGRSYRPFYRHGCNFYMAAIVAIFFFTTHQIVTPKSACSSFWPIVSGCCLTAPGPGIGWSA